MIQAKQVTTTVPKIVLKLPLVVLILLGLCPMARAAESFQITNVIAQGVSIVSYPTNSASTNVVTLGTVTNVVNGVTNITTVTLTSGQQTGRAIETRNYAWGSFKFSGLCTSSNGGFVIFTPIRAVANGGPPIENLVTNYPLLEACDFETLSATNNAPTLSVPIPRGTNIYVTWITNLDEWYTKPADWIGIYAVTNSGQVTDVISNAYAGFGKKIIPLSLSGGNF